MVPVVRVRECCYLLVRWIIGVAAGAVNDTGGVTLVSVVGYRNLSVFGMGVRCCSDEFDAL